MIILVIKSEDNKIKLTEQSEKFRAKITDELKNIQTGWVGLTLFQALHRPAIRILAI